MHLKHGNLNSEYSHHGSECVKKMLPISTRFFPSPLMRSIKPPIRPGYLLTHM